MGLFEEKLFPHSIFTLESFVNVYVSNIFIAFIKFFIKVLVMLSPTIQIVRIIKMSYAHSINKLFFRYYMYKWWWYAIFGTISQHRKFFWTHTRTFKCVLFLHLFPRTLLHQRITFNMLHKYIDASIEWKNWFSRCRCHDTPIQRCF